MKRILITGGAGFVGSNLALRFKASRPDVEVLAFDNLKRRGSELILARLRDGGVGFVHGDVRVRDDLFEIGDTDLVIDCAAEPSVLAGIGGSPDYVIQTNLTGTLNLLELARRREADLLFLSTSRVYPVAPINSLRYREDATRWVLEDEQEVPGASGRGIAEDFRLDGARSLYGASKLASELVAQEYVDSYGMRVIIDRCGVLTGPWQMGKVDQGVIVLWAAKHVYDGKLSYIGYGGTGKQVRDILHVEDLYDLLELQLARIEDLSGRVFNVGGGYGVSVSLVELTELCRSATGNAIEITPVAEDRPNDLISYVTDTTRVQEALGWKPKREPEAILDEITRWIVDHRDSLAPILA